MLLSGPCCAQECGWQGGPKRGGFTKSWAPDLLSVGGVTHGWNPFAQLHSGECRAVGSLTAKVRSFKEVLGAAEMSIEEGRNLDFESRPYILQHDTHSSPFDQVLQNISQQVKL